MNAVINRLGTSLTMGLLLMSALGGRCATPSEENVTLRQYADKIGFHIGSVYEHRAADEEPRYAETVAREYNSFISPTFFRAMQPERGDFRFRSMDNDIEFAKKNHMKLFAATLLYKPKNDPDWVLARGNDAKELDKIMKEHIQTVVKHGGDTYYAWEVVDEPLTTLNPPWGKTLGREQYIDKSYRYAKEANPNALMVLNQAFGHDGVHRDEVDDFFSLLTKLKSSGTPIDVAGIEMHLQAQELKSSYLDEFKYFLQRASKAGVKSMVTEMDVYQGPEGSIPDPMKHQSDIFHDVLAACLADSNCIAFYTWGVSDAHTWLKARPNNALPDAKPLLFDENFKKKPAYYGVLDALKNASDRK
jgi:endo-1,4-beta-xylanase